jgi:nucleotide-binding universal stress UspA family protein
MRNILACVEPLEPARALLSCLRGLSHPEGKIVLLHVADPEPDFVGYGVGPQSVRQSVALELREEHRRLSELALELAAEGVPVTPLMIQGHVVDKILDQAQRLGSELIVLASKGHSALYDLVAGSVVRGVLKGATVPVVLVPPLRS